jgi:hypothetical protein
MCMSVVLFVDQHYLMKKWPMWELGIALEGNNKRGQILLPVLIGDCTFQALDEVMKLYEKDDPEEWKAKGHDKPESAMLEKWTVMLKELKGIVAFRPDQVGQG